VILRTDGGRLDVRVDGDGPTVVLLPSLGRGASDFDDLASRPAAAGTPRRGRDRGARLAGYLKPRRGRPDEPGAGRVSIASTSP
jgi:hypothetical protein